MAGISDIALYIPSGRVTMGELLGRRIQTHPDLEERLKKAIAHTAQEAFHYPLLGEDSVTMAAEVALLLLGKYPQLLESLRYFLVGTETGVDHSKAMSSYVLGLLGQVSMVLPKTLSSYQVQQACAGGMLAVLSTASLIQSGTGHSALVIASDIARYQIPSTAEVTQGAGSAAILLEKDPKLLSFNFPSVGYSSVDVDDFFRPFGSDVAHVKGRFSIECYHDAFETAFLDYAQRKGLDPRGVFEHVDLWCLHTPYAALPRIAMIQLLDKYFSKDPLQQEAYLKTIHFEDTLGLAKEVGNSYTASIFMALRNLLKQRQKEWGRDLEGKRLLLGSYGSGNTMVLVEALLCAGAHEIIASWDEKLPLVSNSSNFDDYESYIGLKKNSRLEKQKGFILQEVRHDGYKIYGYR